MKSKIGTPNNIEVLLHYHVYPSTHPRISAPAVQDATQMLLACGAIKPVDNHYTTTRKGAAWVKLLCRTPEPVEAYIDQYGEII